jgi:hypothetical protein
MLNAAFYYFAGAVLVTLVATFLLCRHSIIRKKKSFFVAALASDVIANMVYCVVVFLSGRFYAEGWHIFTSDAWKSGRLHSLDSAIFDVTLFIGLGTFICLLPVLGIAYYYERRSEKSQANVP